MLSTMANLEIDSTPIFCLPNELLSIILEKISIKEVVNFGMTCSYFRDQINNNQMLWRNKLKAMIPSYIFDVISNICDGNWLMECKLFVSLKNNIILEIIKMSPLYYRKDAEFTFADISPFFKLAKGRCVDYILTVWIICEIIKKGNKLIDTNQMCAKPYTLTGLYYAKTALRFLMHDFLMVKWSQMCRLKELPPEKVINFFIQWTDTENLHFDIHVEQKINELVSKVEKKLESNHPLKSASPQDREKWAKGFLDRNMWGPADNKKVLTAVTQVVFADKHMAVASGANLDTLDILKVIERKCGHITTIGAIYQAVARMCGVCCYLIAFSNHLFLEWRESYDPESLSTAFTVNLSNGAIENKRRCPFTQDDVIQARVPYEPYSLLQHLVQSFNESMGAIQNWNTQNVLLLLDFFERDYNEQNPYRNSREHLTERMSAPRPELDKPIMLQNIDEVFEELIWSLVILNKHRPKPDRPLVVKKHDSSVKFAVGMVCSHLKYDYICVIRGWDALCAASVSWQTRMGVHTLRRGANQPFYSVVAADYSERYVAQENLREVQFPNRLYHLEDVIARDFSHFDGFAYVANEEKRMEYPLDDAIKEMYRNRAQIKK